MVGTSARSVNQKIYRGRGDSRSIVMVGRRKPYVKHVEKAGWTVTNLSMLNPMNRCTECGEEAPLEDGVCFWCQQEQEENMHMLNEGSYV